MENTLTWTDQSMERLFLFAGERKKLVSCGQTLFCAGHYRLQYKRPLSEGLAQFTGLKFTKATSGWWVLVNLRDQLSTTYK